MWFARLDYEIMKHYTAETFGKVFTHFEINSAVLLYGPTVINRNLLKDFCCYG